MKLYIPEISDQIKLSADWTFDLYNEDRNSTLMDKIGDTRKITGSWSTEYGAIPCTIPAGAILKIDRIYIRKGNKEYSSITFLWKGEALPTYVETITNLSGVQYDVKIPRQPIRFWAKLCDVNNIEFEKI